MKSKILIFLLALVSVSAFGQLTKVQDLEIQKGIRFVGRSDSTTISNVGQIQFDADDDKFRFNDGTGWFSYLKEGATLPYWPLSGSATLTNNTDIVVPNDIYSWIGNVGQTQGIVSLPSATDPTVGFILDNSQVTLNNSGITIQSDSDLLIQANTPGSGDLDISGFLTGDISAGADNSFTRITGGGTSVKPGIHFGETATVLTIGVPRIHLGVSTSPNNILITNTTGTYGFSLTLEGDNSSAEAFFRDHSASPKGLQYDADYSSTFGTRSLVDKGYVDSQISGAAFWPLTGTAALTGNVTINGGGTNDLSFGSSGSRLDDLSLYADNQALINVASGNNVNRVILQPGLSSFTLLDTDGMTLDVEILVQPGEADILRIVKDESVTVFEINADGSIVYGAPPTDCSGHATNTIWSDDGTLKLCP